MTIDEANFPPRRSSDKARREWLEMTPDQREQIIDLAKKAIQPFRDTLSFAKPVEQWTAVLDNPHHLQHETLLEHIISAKHTQGGQTWRFLLNHIAPKIKPALTVILRENNRSEEEWRRILLARSRQKGPTP